MSDDAKETLYFILFLIGVIGYIVFAMFLGVLDQYLTETGYSGWAIVCRIAWNTMILGFFIAGVAVAMSIATN